MDTKTGINIQQNHSEAIELVWITPPELFPIVLIYYADDIISIIGAAV